MADYLTSFWCRFDVGAPDNVPRALAIAEALKAELESREDVALGFDIEAEVRRPGSIRLCDADGFGEPEHVITFDAALCRGVLVVGTLGRRLGSLVLVVADRWLRRRGAGAGSCRAKTDRLDGLWPVLRALLDPATDAEAGVVLA